MEEIMNNEIVENVAEEAIEAVEENAGTVVETVKEVVVEKIVKDPKAFGKGVATGGLIALAVGGAAMGCKKLYTIGKRKVENFKSKRQAAKQAKAVAAESDAVEVTADEPETIKSEVVETKKSTRRTKVEG